MDNAPLFQNSPVSVTRCSHVVQETVLESLPALSQLGYVFSPPSQYCVIFLDDLHL